MHLPRDKLSVILYAPSLFLLGILRSQFRFIGVERTSFHYVP
jgi:hypothetical protein